MPNRILKESICTSDTLDQLTAEEECFFYRLIVNCDDFGLMDAREAVLRSRLYPLRVDRVTTDEMLGYLARLQAVGLIEVYEVRGRRYLHITSWDDHQQRRAQKPKFPLPNDPNATAIALAPLPAHSSQSANLQSVDSNGNQLQSHVPVFVSGNVIENENEHEKSAAAPRARALKETKKTKEPAPQGFGDMWAAFALELNGKPTTAGEQKKWADAIKELLRGGVTPDMVPRLVARYHSRFGEIVCNPRGISNNLTELREGANRNGHASPAPVEITEEQRAEDIRKELEWAEKNTTPPSYLLTTTNGLSARLPSATPNRQSRSGSA